MHDEVASVIPCAVAGPATSPTSVPAGIFRVEWMSSEAVSLPSVQRGLVEASKDVNLAGYRFQVSGIYTVAHSAKMIRFKPCRYRTHKQFVGETVGSHIVPVNTDSPITRTGAPRSPKPARAKIGTVVRNGTVLVDLRPETFFDRRPWVVNISMPLPALVVHKTPPTTLPLFLASWDRTGRLDSHRVLSGVIGPDVCASRPSFILPQMREKVQP